MVTGADSGIGKATCLRLANMGARVVMVSRDRGLGETATSEIIGDNDSDSVDV